MRSRDARPGSGLLPHIDIPQEFSSLLEAAGKQWAASNQRPRISSDMKKHWDSLVDAWAASQLPLVIRKSGELRGATVLHCTGRKLIIADNSPAQWAFSWAYAGHSYSLAQIEDMIQKDEVPFAFATKAAEKAHMAFKRTLLPSDCVNRRGWKLCHIKEVGLRTKTKLEDISIEILTEHFQNLLKPSNQFLIQLKLAGLGEVKEIIEAVKTFEDKQQLFSAASTPVQA